MKRAGDVKTAFGGKPRKEIFTRHFYRRQGTPDLFDRHDDAHAIRPGRLQLFRAPARARDPNIDFIGAP
jgi:hypothetical protein